MNLLYLNNQRNYIKTEHNIPTTSKFLTQNLFLHEPCPSIPLINKNRLSYLGPIPKSYKNKTHITNTNININVSLEYPIIKSNKCC